MLFTFWLIPFFFLQHSAFADSALLSLEEFLVGAFGDEGLAGQDEAISILQDGSVVSPMIREVEFRMKTDEFDKDQGEYAVRLKPTGWGETQSADRLSACLLEYNRSLRDQLIAEAVRERYDLIVDYLHQTRLIALIRQLIVLHQDRAEALKQSVGSLDFDPEDLIGADADVIEARRELAELSADLERIEDEIRRRMPGRQRIDFAHAGLVGIDHIDQVATAFLSEEPGAVFSENARLAAASLETQVMDARLELEKSVNRRYLSFVEAAYDMDDRDDFNKAFSVRLGISIPLDFGGGHEVLRRKLDALETRNRYRTLQKETAAEAEVAARQVRRLIGRYRLLEGRDARGRTKSSYETFSRIEGVDPLVLLKLQEEILKIDIALCKTGRSIYGQYLEFLDLTGQLCQKPFQNHLSIGQEAPFL